MKRVIIKISILCVLILGISCSPYVKCEIVKDSSDLVGLYHQISFEYSSNKNILEDMELFKDGTVIYKKYNNAGEVLKTYKGKWLYSKEMPDKLAIDFQFNTTLYRLCYPYLRLGVEKYEYKKVDVDSPTK